MAEYVVDYIIKDEQGLIVGGAKTLVVFSGQDDPTSKGNIETLEYKLELSLEVTVTNLTLKG